MRPHKFNLHGEFSLTELAIFAPTLPATDEDLLPSIEAVQDAFLKQEQVPIPTQHTLHAGMYARTITMPSHTILVGTLIKIPTMVITVGSAKVLVGRDWADVDGFQVLPAEAHRKQIFVSRSAFIITMIFPTNATTIGEAEDEFTAEGDLLLSRRQPSMNKVMVTGE